jgi:ribosomal protein L37E
MGWPKGKPRKGYVNKSGEPHAKRGTRLSETPTKARATSVRQRVQVARQETTPVGTGETKKEWKPLLRHASWSLPADECPACGFPEADGGYCNACGWSKPIKYGRVE